MQRDHADRRLVLLGDADIRVRLDAGLALRAARRALVAAYHGDLIAPPRLHADIGDVSLAFTVGGYSEGVKGFRAYGTWPGDDDDQVVCVWDEDGRVRGVVLGWELGARRTGALGAAAIAAMANRAATRVGLVGSGRQAWSQLWALTAVMTPAEVRVYSPTLAHRVRFVERARSELGVATTVALSAEEAVREADIVILATTSRTPVVEADWIKNGAHVSTVGPKTLTGHETPLELIERVALVASDSPKQAQAYPEEFFLQQPLVDLGAILAGAAPGRHTESEVTLFCSTGLAGSEVVLAAAVLGVK